MTFTHFVLILHLLARSYQVIFIELFFKFRKNLSAVFIVLYSESFLRVLNMEKDIISKKIITRPENTGVDYKKPNIKFKI